MAAAFTTGDLLRRALGWTLGHLGVLARVAAPAIVFATILRLAIDQLWGGEVTAMMETGVPSGTALLARLLALVVELLAVALVAVAWHRYVLRGEITPFPAGAVTLRFALYQLWLGLLGGVVVMAGLFVLTCVLGLLGGPALMQSFAVDAVQPGGLPVMLVMALLIAIMMTVPFAFYGLIFPAVAIGDRGLVAAESRRLLRGHRMAVLVALAATSVLSLIVAIGLGFVLSAILPEEDGFGLVGALTELVSLALAAVVASVFAGVLSELYRALRLPELARGAAPE